MKLWKQPLQNVRSRQRFHPPIYKAKRKRSCNQWIALFNKDKLTGLLPSRQSVLFVLLTDKMGTSARITQKLTNSDSSNTSDYITIDVSNQKLKRNLKITTDKKEMFMLTLSSN